MNQDTKTQSLLSKLFGGRSKKDSQSCCNVRIEEVQDDEAQASTHDEGKPDSSSRSRDTKDGAGCCKPPEAVRKADSDE